ncbi:MAG: hypothetical protein QOK38_4072 [Acidobacteriaceae bacterium]|jgi:hypothetical protein|nr:hypothetical protein [Acidobacteriaceae bacterium]
MKLLASLDRRDQRLLLITAILALCTTVLLVLVHPEEQADNYIPSTYSTAPHGAKAAYLLLAHMGYRVERSEGPLGSIADTADVHTVLILAEPTRAPSQQEAAAVRRVLARGGRVLAAGFLAAAAVPDENLDNQSPSQLVGGICEAEPVGFSPLAADGKVVMRGIRSVWKMDRPSQRAAFLCAGEGVVVTYAVEKGTVVWWASASPLENQDITARGSLDLLLNSLQLQHGDRIVWDESLHAAPTAAWNPFSDRIVLALIGQLFLIGLLLVLARGRRSGPLRPLPELARTSPMEFVRSLGGLYRSSGANDVPVTIAYERFRARLAQRHGISGAQTADAATLAATLTERFGIMAPSLQRDLEACENAGRLSSLNPRQALTLVKALAGYNELVMRRAESSTTKVTHLANYRGTIGPEYAPADARKDHTQRRTA